MKLDEKTVNVLDQLKKFLPGSSSSWNPFLRTEDRPIPLFDDTPYTDVESMYPAPKFTNHHQPFSNPAISNRAKVGALLKELRSINKKKQIFESGFISKEGLRDREWFKHKGTGPGLWLGYGATTFPALTEGEWRKRLSRDR